MNELSFFQLRLTNKKLDPISFDYLLGNELILLLLHNSLFHYSVIVEGDVYQFIDSNYPQELHYLRLNFYKYQLSVDSITELVKSLNNNPFSLKVKLEQQPMKPYQSDNSYLVLLSLFDMNNNSISSLRIYIGEEKTNNSKISSQKWINLKTLNEKVFVYLSTRENLFCNELDRLCFDFPLINNEINLKRLNYFYSNIYIKNGSIFKKKILINFNSEKEFCYYINNVIFTDNYSLSKEDIELKKKFSLLSNEIEKEYD